MVKHIVPFIPPHKKYVEPFAGGAAVFFAKGPSQVEVLNDLNGNVSNFYRVMKLRFDDLAKEIEATLHCESNYKRAREIYRNPGDYNELERAWAFWVGSAMSFGSNLFTHFQITSNSADRSNPGSRTAYRRRRFKKTAGRLDKVMVLEKDALAVLEKYNQPDTFAYVDPPYIGVNQGHYKGYTEEDFRALLSLLSEFSGKWILSSYRSDMLDEFTDEFGWNKREIDQRLGVKGTKQRKVEVLTGNFVFEPNLFTSISGENQVSK